MASFRANEKTLASLEITYHQEKKLIYEFDHWHYCLSGEKEKLMVLIGELGLED